jgi:NTE family protein
VLVLQGGGALGAYQGGVYQAMHEAGVEPDWVIGTSIGAINAALIAGNAPERRMDRLREFWSRVEQGATHDFMGFWSGLHRRSELGDGRAGILVSSSNPAQDPSHIPLGAERRRYPTALLRETCPSRRVRLQQRRPHYIHRRPPTRNVKCATSTAGRDHQS